ncbi:MAG: hypothetical protein QOE94_3904 [Mycobacterium sp.]|jgi:hypothetical protein|nr:hypothetical protein [Mycobacterium sp.]
MQEHRRSLGIRLGAMPAVLMRSTTVPVWSRTASSPWPVTVQYSLPSAPNFIPSGPMNSVGASPAKTLPKNSRFGSLTVVS